MTDTPITYTNDGKPIYDNTPTVVSVILYSGNGILAVRRANKPGEGLLGLPGGYHMRNETWQEAGCREVKEEIGVDIDPNRLCLLSMETDEYGNNLAIALCLDEIDASVELHPQEGEVLEVCHITTEDMIKEDAIYDWAFPRHFDAVLEPFINRQKRLLRSRAV